MQKSSMLQVTFCFVFCGGFLVSFIFLFVCSFFLFCFAQLELYLLLNVQIMLNVQIGKSQLFGCPIIYNIR